jgi:hypothetical protein
VPFRTWAMRSTPTTMACLPTRPAFRSSNLVIGGMCPSRPVARVSGGGGDPAATPATHPVLLENRLRRWRRLTYVDERGGPELRGFALLVALVGGAWTGFWRWRRCCGGPSGGGRAR